MKAIIILIIIFRSVTIWYRYYLFAPKAGDKNASKFDAKPAITANPEKFINIFPNE